MYTASTAFHEAVADGKPQMAILLFEDAVFTNQDIRVDNGVELNEYFNTDEDLSIGQTPSSELTFTLFNDEGYLDDYVFGEFLATLGVQLSETIAGYDTEVYLVCGNHTWTVEEDGMLIKRDGVAVSAQPENPVTCGMAYDGKVYFMGANSGIVYTNSSGAVDEETPINRFMKHKGFRLKGYGAYYNKNTRILKVYYNNRVTTYEFVPLGIFTADRPNVPTVIEIDFTCYDRMQKFEIDMPSSTDLNISYPTTIGTLYTKMCDYVGVSYETATFLNSDADITSEPEEFSSNTMRKVLGWIAEAAASNARFDRDGVLKLDWVRTTTQELDESNYSSFEPYWYETEQVTKLYNRDTASGEDKTYGDGGVGYLIQDNPLLKGVK